MDSSRRKFLNSVLGLLGLGGVASALFPVIKYLEPVKSRNAVVNTCVAGKVGDLVPNSGKLFKFGSKPGILVMTPSGEYKAFTAVCTHLGCTVQYSHEDGGIWCACHNGHYDLNGNVISGPPPKGLEEFDVAINKDEIFVTRRA